MSSRHRAVDEQGHPNCLGSISCLISSKIHSTTKSSRTFDIHDVNEIGRRSFFFLWEVSLLESGKFSHISSEKGW